MFWCIVLSTLTLRWFWKSEKRRAYQKKAEKLQKQEVTRRVADRLQAEPIPKVTDEERAAIFAEQELKAKQKKDIEDLRRQGYSDEMIAIIIPTIYNGQ